MSTINNKQYLYIIIILFGFFLSVITSSYYVSTYDKYTKNGYDHQLIKDETYYHWRQGDKLAKYVPSLIYLSVFFGVGLNMFIDFIKNFKKSF